MDQIAIGKFIAQCRKEKKLTQAQLAERLGVSDKAVSKWENGRSMPDCSIMLELCAQIGITVNDLLNGRRIDMENYKEKAEQTLFEMREREESANRTLLRLEIVIGLLATASFLTLIAASALADMPTAARVALITISIAIFITGMHFAMKIEQSAGYYECRRCGHRYVPTITAVYAAPHSWTTRYMKCPCCGQKSWQKKALTKEV